MQRNLSPWHCDQGGLAVCRVGADGKPESGAGSCRPCHVCSDHSQITLYSVEHALELYAAAPALIPLGSEDLHCGLDGDAPGVDRDSCA